MPSRGNLLATVLLVTAATAITSCGKFNWWDDGEGPSPYVGGFAIKDVVYRRAADGGGDQVTIDLMSVPGSCALYKTGAQTPSHDFDLITLEFKVASGTLGTGTMRIVDPRVDSKGLFYDATQGTAFYDGVRGCGFRYGTYASGTVEITRLDSAGIEGSYDLSFENGWPFGDDGKTRDGKVSGSTRGPFTAQRCDPPPDTYPYLHCDN